MLPGNGQAQARAPLLHASLVLLERLENSLLSIQGNTWSRIYHLEAIPMLRSGAHPQYHLACFGELDGIAQ